MSRRARFAAALVGGYLLAVPGFSAAATSEAKIASPAASVRLILVGALRDVALTELLEEWLRSSGIASEVVYAAHFNEQHLAAEATSGRMTLWLTREEDTVNLTFLEPTERRYFVRSLPLATGLDEVGREQLAQVVLASAQAFMAHAVSSTLAEVRRSFTGGAPAKAPPRAATDSAAPAPAPVARSPAEVMTLGIGLGYEFLAAENYPTRQGPAVNIEVSRQFSAITTALRARAGYGIPREKVSDVMAVREVSGAVAGALSVGFPASYGIGAHLELGAGYQVTQVEPIQVSDSVLARAKLTEGHPQLLAGLGLRWTSDVLWFQVQGRLAWELAQPAYQLADQEQVNAWVEPPRLRLGFGVEAGFRALQF